MKRKVFLHMCLLALVTVLIAAVLITAVIYKEYFDQMKEKVRNEADYLTAAIDSGGEAFLDVIRGTSDRFTLIAENGTVLYDSQTDASNMENHLNRPEIAAALSAGSGEALRESPTLGSRTFYAAVRLADGRVLRVASEVGSVFTAVRMIVPYLLLITVMTFALAMLFANLQTKWIVGPINRIDPEHPMENDVYDELAPLLSRMNRQNLQIEAQIAEIRHKQEELSAVTEHMREGLVILDAKGAVLYINQSAIRIFDVKGTDYLRKNILTLNRNLALRKTVEDAAAGRAAEEAMEVGERQYRIVGNAVKVDGVRKGLILLILDETEKRAAEQMRREFTANVSHELKTPLTSISGYAEIIKNGLAKTEDVPRFADRIYTEAARMTSLVQDILLLSQLDEGAAGLPNEQIDLFAVAREVCERLGPEAEKRGVLLAVEGEPAVVNGARRILDDIVFNLCDNAIKYNKENGKVDVSISREEKQVVLTVTDTGIGIPKEHRDRVFERFYRVDKSHSKETGGTGLGLSIVKHGAQYHRAKIELESESGKGTTVRLRFPEAAM